MTNPYFDILVAFATESAGANPDDKEAIDEIVRQLEPFREMMDKMKEDREAAIEEFLATSLNIPKT